MRKRVVITGLGIVSPIGNSPVEFWQSLASGIASTSTQLEKQEDWTQTCYSMKIKSYDLTPYVPKIKIRRLSKVVQMAIFAAYQALADAQIGPEDLEDLGIVFGTGFGGFSNTYNFYKGMLELGPEAAEPYFFPHTVPNAAASEVAIALKSRGPNTTISYGANSGENALLMAIDAIQTGRADRFLVGGADDSSQILTIGFQHFQALATEEPPICRPYDRKRSGTVLGEGCGVIVIESLESAVKRNAKIYMEITGIGFYGGNALPWQYSSSGQAKPAVDRALIDASLTTEGIDYLQTCANSSLALDSMEARVIRDTFGPKLPPCSSVIPFLGEFMGMGILRIAALALSFQNILVPPLLNTNDIDPECSLNIVSKPTPLKLQNALYTNFAPGGYNVCLVFSYV